MNTYRISPFPHRGWKYHVGFLVLPSHSPKLRSQSFSSKRYVKFPCVLRKETRHSLNHKKIRWASLETEVKGCQIGVTFPSAMYPELWVATIQLSISMRGVSLLGCSGIYAKQAERVSSVTAGRHLCEICPYFQQMSEFYIIFNLHHIHLLTSAHWP